MNVVDPSSSAVHTENLCRHYQMGEALVRAVDGISIDIRAGEFVALLGASGSGKSSLLNLIAGLDRPTSGTVIVHGSNLAALSREEFSRYRLRTVGMVFQSFNLIPSMSLMENVELPMRFAEIDRRERAALARKSLERVGLGGRVAHRPMELSGGEQQRASLARALINQPKFLLADEPTGNLDSRTGTEIMELIRGFNQSLGMTVLMVTHEQALAEKYAGRMLHLADGKMVNDLSPVRRFQRAPARRDSMKFYDVTDLAVRNLRESIFRNSLTTIGISVGVASLVAMLSLGIGLQQLASQRLQKSGLFDTVVATSRRDLGNFREQRENNTQPANSARLDEPARQKIEQLPGVVEAYPDIRFVTEIRFDDKPHLTMVAGLPFSAKSNDAFDDMQGSFFSSDTAAEVIVQKSFAEELLGKTPPPGTDTTDIARLGKSLLGKQVTMRYAERTASPASSGSADGAAYSVVSRQQVLKIVGVTDLDPETLRAAARARIFLPLKLAQNLHVMQPSDLRDTSVSDTPTYLSLSVRVKDPNQILPVEDLIKKMGFNAFSILDATQSMRQFFAVLDVFLGIFGSLALAVASIGIVNTLVMAILERRREIGIMKALGASDGDVRGLFFAEAGAMGLVGGVAGVTLGWTIGRIINFGTNIYLKRQHFPPAQIWSMPLWLVLGAIAFSIVVSLLSGLYPASRAARLDPVQALRYE